MRFLAFRYQRIGGYVGNVFSLLFLLLGSSSVAIGQYSMTFERISLPLTELPKLQTGKSMIIFDSEYELHFDSNNENLPKPEYMDGRYLLAVTEGPQLISVFYNGIPTVLNFGTQSSTINLHERISAGDVLRFKVKVRAELEYSDITESELKRGSGIVPIGMNVSDAMIVFRKFPDDLELTIIEKNGNITKRTKDGNALNVSLLVKESGENRYFITVVSNEGDSLNIPIQSLTSKEVRVFRVKKPIMESPLSMTNATTVNAKQESTVPSDELKNTVSVLKKDFSLNVVGFWAGSLGDKKVNLDISRLDPERNSIEGRIFIDGMKANFKGQVRFKNVDEYQASISFKSQGSTYYGATIDFAYRKGVMTGLYIDDTGNVRDFTSLRTQRLMADTTAMVRISKGVALDALKGEWFSRTGGSGLIASIEISNLNMGRDLDVRVLTYSREVISKRCRLTGTPESPTIYMSDFKTKDVPMSSTLTIFFRDSRLEANLTGDDGSFFRLGSFYKK
jgi:hypothetical protein